MGTYFPGGIWTPLEGERAMGTCPVFHRVTFHGLFDTCHCVDCQITRGAEMITQQGIHLSTRTDGSRVEGRQVWAIPSAGNL